MANRLKSVLIVAVLCTGTAIGAADSGVDAPNFALKALDGKNHRLSEYRGEVVLLNFWASWCGTCRSQLSGLQEFHQRYHEAGLTILGINIDEHDHDAADLAGGLEFPILRDTRHNVSELYDLNRLPLTVLIDRDGVVRHVYDGKDARSSDAYLADLRELLRE
jgi:peroxiredoxin